MSFSREDQLIISCARAYMDDNTKAKALDLLKQTLDWSYIVEAAIDHAVAPLLYCGLKQVCDSADLSPFLPFHASSELRRLYAGNRLRNRRLYDAIDEVAGVFNHEGIDILGLKDLELAQRVYPDVAMRPMGDVDLLIKYEQYEAAAASLAQLGFFPVPSADMPYTLKYAWGHHFRREEDNIWLDVQWNVMQMEWDQYQEGSFKFDIQQIWKRAKRMLINSHSILVPSPEDMLFHLCMHLEGHRYCELILFCDIAEWMQVHHHTADWPYFVSLVHQYKAESSIYYVLLLTAQLFGAPVPVEILRQLTPTYFKANLSSPLFDNLTLLHLSLDEFRSKALCPASQLDSFERETRCQTAAAQKLYRELYEVADAFTATGERLILFGGTSSEKIYPDGLLDAFGTTDILVVDEDMPELIDALQQRQFGVSKDGVQVEIRKHCVLQSVDPAVAGRLPALEISGESVTEIKNLLDTVLPKTRSKAKIAIRLLRNKLIGPRFSENVYRARVRVISLPREQLLVYLAVSAGKQSRDHLFAMCTLLEFCRRHGHNISWEKVDTILQEFGISDELKRGLSLISSAINVPARLLSPSGKELRIFEAARYDPEQTSQYTDLKDGFLLCLTFLSLEKGREKAKYFAKCLHREFTHPVLTRSVLASLRVVAARFRPAVHTAGRFAYWMEFTTGPSISEIGEACTSSRQYNNGPAVPAIAPGRHRIGRS